MIGDKAIKFQFDSISLPYEGEYAACHKISDGHFGNELHYHVIMKYSFHYLGTCFTQLKVENTN